MIDTQTHVFISYSHRDKEHLQRLLIHLSPYTRTYGFKIWDDTQINASDIWLEEIEKALEEAIAAVLLISADFLASDFINTKEVPVLLEAAEKRGVNIIPVIIKPSAFSEIPEISKFQAANNPQNPIISLTEAEKEATWADLAKKIKDLLNEVDLTKYDQKTLFAENKELTIEERLESIFRGVNDEKIAGHPLLRDALNNPHVIQNYYVYWFHYIDDQAFIHLPSNFIYDSELEKVILKEVATRFKYFGWAEEGEIGLIWFPDFAWGQSNTTVGHLIWHVKQFDNGTSWLASATKLPFDHPNLELNPFKRPDF